MKKGRLGSVSVLVFWASLAGAFAAAPASAAPADTYVPAPLEPWKAWVLKGYEDHNCPFLANQARDNPEYICAWPGRLDLSADQHGASFSIHWRVEAAGWIPLPGDEDHWPQPLTVNGHPAPVVLRDYAPSVWLEPGSYDIRGSIAWDQRPQELRVPDRIGLLSLRVDGQPIALPEREEEGLTLGRGSTSRESESVDVKVFRKLTDDVPAMLETRIELDVSGLDREIVFGQVLPAGFAPVSLGGDLASRLDADGRLRVQLQSGQWELKLLARATGPLSAVAWDPPAKPWPGQEVWSYESSPRLRITSAHGAAPIDPVQADVPGDWASLPAFVMVKGKPLTIEESSRGLAGTDRNDLSLEREAWRDFNGGAYYYKDVIKGDMKQGWRLDVSSPYVLEHASEKGDEEDKPLLVTAGEKPGDQGVEVRNPKVEVMAGLRLQPDSGALPVTGWHETFEHVATRLSLPHGYLLLGAPGADSALGSWVSYWTLLDVFIVAVIVALAFRLFGRRGGVLALLFLVLAYPEPGVPVVTLAAVCLFELLRKVLPQGRLHHFAGWLGRAALVLFVLVALPFLAAQVHYALYPQLQPMDEWGSANVSPGARLALASHPQKMVATLEAAPPPPPSPPAQYAPLAEVPAPAPSANQPQLGKIEVTGSRIKMSDLVERYTENTVVQAGEGEPGWEGGSEYYLSWTGPVTADQTVRLLILPPWATRLLRLVVVALLGALIYVLASRTVGGSGRAPADLRKWARRFLGLGALLLFTGLALPRPAQADAAFPPADLLKDLRTRLTEPPACAPTCAAIAAAHLRAAGDEVDLLLQVQALDRVALAVPAAGENMVLEQVQLDGAPVDGVVLGMGRSLLTVPRGVHAVSLRFGVPSAGRVSLSFPLRPASLDFSGDGWQAEGIGQHRLQTGSVTLVRQRAAVKGASAGVAQQFPPFVTLNRQIMLNLDWGVANKVTRVSPAQGGFSLAIPLLANEHVLSKKFTVKDGLITVPVPDADEVYWQSSLDRSPTFTLTAPPMTDHAEVWQVVVSPTWHAEFSGLPAVEPQRQDDDFWIYEFHPLPGEKLTVTVTRPAGVPGPTLAIDAATLDTQAGQHAGEKALHLKVRSTQAGDHVITLPEGAELMSVAKDGKSLNLPLLEGKLALPITAAVQQFDIKWRDKEGAGLLDRTPEVDLGTVAANVDLSLSLPQDRWVLLAGGPRLGPAVLYWGELLVMILVAWGLGRMGGTPLRFRQWLLLGLGFSTFSWSALLAVVAWLLALEWRAGHKPEDPSRFKLLQTGLAILTVIAMASLVSSIPYGLLGQPDMHLVSPGGAPGELHWFADRSEGLLPRAWVFTLPLWCYKLAMLAWALWLAFALVEWLRWAFSAWSKGGYWPEKPKSEPAPSK